MKRVMTSDPIKTRPEPFQGLIVKIREDAGSGGGGPE